MKIEWEHPLALGTPFATAFECPLCGAMVWPSGRGKHEIFHDNLIQTAQQADSADGMWRPLA